MTCSSNAVAKANNAGCGIGVHSMYSEGMYSRVKAEARSCWSGRQSQSSRKGWTKTSTTRVKPRSVERESSLRMEKASRLRGTRKAVMETIVWLTAA